MKAKGIVLCLLFVLLGVAQEKKPELQPLITGRPVERELTPDEAQRYTIRLNAGDFIDVTVDQNALETVLALTSQDGKRIGTGQESLSYIAIESGTYQIEVKAQKTNSSGRYVIQLEGPRSATDRDRKVFEAAQILEAGTALADNSTEESQQKAIGKFNQALSVYQGIKHRRGEAKTLNNLGIANDYLGLFEQARQYYDQALVISQELRDNRTKAALLRSLSFVYYHLTQYEKAREYTEKCLAASREINDKDGEREALNNLNLINGKLKNPAGADNAKSKDARSKENSNSSTGGSFCVCRQLLCNANGCWWHYYYCYC